jgi:ribosomal protein S19
MPVRIIQEMVGHKYGEFSLTRKKNQRQELGSKKK